MIRTLSIRNVPREMRVKGAITERQQLRQLLSNPLLTVEQRAELQRRLQLVGERENLPFEKLVPEPITFEPAK